MASLKSVLLVPFALTVLAVPVRTSAQTPTIPGELLKDWQAQKETMMKIADAMPAEKFNYKSTPAQRTYAEQILHVAGANVELLQLLGAKTKLPFEVVPTDMATFGLKMTDKAAVMKALNDSYDYGDAVMKELGPGAMTEVVKGPPWIGQATRAKMVWYTMGHTQDIYGQMAVYLRLNGIVPPASRRGGI
jgi:DinB family protein